MTSKTLDQLVEQALGAFDDPTATAASHVRRAVRIATKRQDYLNMASLVPWTIDIAAARADGQTVTEHPLIKGSRDNLVALLGRQETDRQLAAVLVRHMALRTSGTGTSSDGVYASSIGQLEAQLTELDDINEGYKRLPPNLGSAETVRLASAHDSASAKILPMRHALRAVIERARQNAHDFLVETEQQIEQGQEHPTVFDRGREYLEKALDQRAPRALVMFRAAEAALATGDEEDLSHALTSCRRMVKALADALYPATGNTIRGSDGRDRVMSDDAYRNRLMQFAVEQLSGSAHGELVQESLRSLGERLQRLNQLSSKGVHGDVTHTEAETCLLWTYLTVADFLRIADSTRPAANQNAVAASSGEPPA